jgi:GTP pyrophosphokinase
LYDISHDWEDPQDLHELLQEIREQRGDANLRKIRYAYFIAEKAHKGQTRNSGEPYIIHPLAVARILVELRMDDDAIVAALLHDVLEDTEVTAEELKADFGDDVLHLVDGVTKLKLKDIADQSARQRAAAEASRIAETLRHMILAMAKDFRVMVIKLSDRLHNMQTLDALSPERKARIATETLNIYAPLAARLGIWQIKWQLEDLSFKHLHPEEFHRISEQVARTRADRQHEIETAILTIKDRFKDHNLKIVDIRGRPKHLYSIFNKMVKQGIEFSDIYDLQALRIIVETNTDCYVALGIVHEIWTPINTMFFDYIAQPKSNGYQSLHTKVYGPSSQPLEVQIRTLAMHETAEYGVAAHWTYKEGKAVLGETAKLGALRKQLHDWSTNTEVSSDYLRSLSTDLFGEQVFVFTPKGDVIDLPTGSTPVDFAFRVHTQLGMTLVGARVNGNIAPLSTKLQNGDVCELLTRKDATPSMDWLEFVQSPHTRTKIRSHFRKLTKNSDAANGRAALEKELRWMGQDPKKYLGDDKLQKVADTVDSCENPIDLLAKVGLGLVGVQSVISKLRGLVHDAPAPEPIQLTQTREGKLTLATRGMESVLVTRGKCCSPIPGDDVIGYVSRGRGIVIHRRVCPNAQSYLSSEPERLLNYDWLPDGGVYQVSIRVLAVDRPGLINDITSVLGESKTNVSRFKVKVLPNHTAEIDMIIDVKDTVHLSLMMTKISNFGDVLSIMRMFGRAMVK